MGVDIVIIPIFKVGSLGQSEVKEFAQCHPAGKWQSQDLNPGRLASIFPATISTALGD